MRKKENKVKFNGKRFISSLGLWIVGVLLSTIPIVYKNLSIFFNADESGEPFDYVKNFWIDQDFLFIGFSSGFLLFLELFFLESHYNRPIQKIIEGFLIFYTLILIIIYTISYFNSNWVSKWGEDNVLILNKMVLALLIVFGVMAFVVKAFESERKEGLVKC